MDIKKIGNAWQTPGEPGDWQGSDLQTPGVEGLNLFEGTKETAYGTGSDSERKESLKNYTVKPKTHSFKFNGKTVKVVVENGTIRVIPDNGSEENKMADLKNSLMESIVRRLAAKAADPQAAYDSLIRTIGEENSLNAQELKLLADEVVAKSDTASVENIVKVIEEINLNLARLEAKKDLLRGLSNTLEEQGNKLNGWFAKLKGISTTIRNDSLRGVVEKAGAMCIVRLKILQEFNGTISTCWEGLHGFFRLEGSVRVNKPDPAKVTPKTLDELKLLFRNLLAKSEYFKNNMADFKKAIKALDDIFNEYKTILSQGSKIRTKTVAVIKGVNFDLKNYRDVLAQRYEAFIAQMNKSGIAENFPSSDAAIERAKQRLKKMQDMNISGGDDLASDVVENWVNQLMTAEAFIVESEAELAAQREQKQIKKVKPEVSPEQLATSENFPKAEDLPQKEEAAPEQKPEDELGTGSSFKNGIQVTAEEVSSANMFSDSTISAIEDLAAEFDTVTAPLEDLYEDLKEVSAVIDEMNTESNEAISDAPVEIEMEDAPVEAEPVFANKDIENLFRKQAAGGDDFGGGARVNISPDVIEKEMETLVPSSPHYEGPKQFQGKRDMQTYVKEKQAPKEWEPVRKLLMKHMPMYALSKAIEIVSMGMSETIKEFSKKRDLSYAPKPKDATEITGPRQVIDAKMALLTEISERLNQRLVARKDEILASPTLKDKIEFVEKTEEISAPNLPNIITRTWSLIAALEGDWTSEAVRIWKKFSNKVKAAKVAGTDLSVGIGAVKTDSVDVKQITWLLEKYISPVTKIVSDKIFQLNELLKSYPGNEKLKSLINRYNFFLSALNKFPKKMSDVAAVVKEPHQEKIFRMLEDIVDAWNDITELQIAKGGPEDAWILSNPLLEHMEFDIKLLLSNRDSGHSAYPQVINPPKASLLNLFAADDAMAIEEETGDTDAAELNAAADELVEEMGAAMEEYVDSYIAIVDEIEEAIPADAAPVSEEVPAEEALAFSSETGKLEKTAQSIIAPIAPNDMYSSYDLSENNWELQEADGKKKLVINKSLKNLVTKRMNEFLKGAFKEGDVVNVDFGNSITVGTVQAYLGNKMYKVALGGMVATVPEVNLFKI